MDKVAISVGSAIVTAAAFWLLGLFSVTPTFLLPKGAVVAFDETHCPKEWEPFEKAVGRVVVGAGEAANVPVRTPGEQGGSATAEITLTESHLPKHQHEAPVNTSAENRVEWGVGEHRKSIAGADQRVGLTANTSYAGEGAPIILETMPPFVGLLYCYKTR